MMVPYMTNCMAGIFKAASRKARSDVVRRLVFTLSNFSIS